MRSKGMISLQRIRKRSSSLDPIRSTFEHYDAWDRHAESPGDRLNHVAHFNQLRRHRSRSGRILDVAGSTGGMAVALARDGCRVTPLDFSQAMPDNVA